ncbi:MAG: glycoside hydrolase family 127 protein [Oscillospiraceae bacterium]|nr:glycoside hydrolase family 127 protein [Oscillospiraceae bacterium]
MKTYGYTKVDLTGGYLFEKQELNRTATIKAVYDRFDETGRVGAFRFDWKPGDDLRPHIFWDSDIAKWMEGAAYILAKHADPELEKKVDDLVALVKKNQDENGYFNIYYTVVEPENRFTDRECHELYCAGHMMEAAVAIAEATGKTDLLDCMEKYADHIHKVFVEDNSAGFFTPGHEEIELALVKMYRYTGKKKFLDLCAHFINTRGTVEEKRGDIYTQSHMPVREQAEAVGHSVRACYLYTGMADLAIETGDEALKAACRKLFDNMANCKMYVTGGLGSTYMGEAFTGAYDLPNDTAYAETCASIGMIFFAHRMMQMDGDAKYADMIELQLYNGMLSGLSADGAAFFYENPLEINLSEQYDSAYYGKRRFPITERVECFSCSCCPPNLNRVLPSMGQYVYGIEGDTLFVNQYIGSVLKDSGISCTMTTDYPRTGTISVKAEGTAKVALRIPGWCRGFTLNKPYVMEKGYAVVENDGEIILELDMQAYAVFADPRVLRDAGKLAIRRGPIVYCAEGVDNGSDLHSYLVKAGFKAAEVPCEFGLPALDIPCKKLLPLESGLYSAEMPGTEDAVLRMIPYNAFANRGESDMLVWLTAALG